MAIDFHCSCGQSVSVPENTSASQVTCPACHNAIPVPAADLFAPSIPMMAQEALPQPAVSAKPTPVLSYVAGSTDPVVTPRAVESLRQTIPWVRTIAVLIFISTGILLSAGVVILVVGMKFHRPTALLGLLYLPPALFCMVPATHLWRFAANAGTFVQLRHENSLEAALHAQKSYWKFVAITALLASGVYVALLATIYFNIVISP